MSGAVDPRRAALLVAAAALLAAAVVLPALGADPADAPGPERAAAVERSTLPGPAPQSPRSAQPDATARAAARTETSAVASEAPSDPAVTAPRQDPEPAATHDPATPRTALPGTVRADNRPDAATLTAAREVAAAWVRAFATLDPEGHDAWLERLRPHSTERLLAALAHPATVEAAAPLAGSVRVLAAGVGPATADRIGVRVRFMLDPDPAEHALEVVVVPDGDGPRVDEVRL